MTDDLDLRKGRGRAAKQERSERTRGAIVHAVIEVLAEQGVAGLTHRLVAQRSGASLAATTYYFTGKPDMIAEASDELLRVYFGEFEQIAAMVCGGGPAAFRAFVADLAARAMTDHRTSTLAWCEIMLDGAREPEARALVRPWFQRMNEVWQRAARAFGMPEPDAAARAAMDVTLGALFHGLALGLGAELMAASLGRGVPADALFPPPPARPAGPAAPRATAKAAATRERILEAAIQLLARRGASAVNYRAVALEAGLTAGAPAYHFASAEDLLAQAEARLFSRSKARYGEVLAGAFDGLDLATLVELAAVIFQSEATEFGALNIATYGIWLQAARGPQLRPVVLDAVGDLHRAWGRILRTLKGAAQAPDPLMVQYLFVGALIRVISCGVTAWDLVEVRGQLKRELTAMAEGRHWLQARA
jgi:DNA-binding transcriptional regulator YbjK